MAIEIIEAELNQDILGEQDDFWSCWLEIDQAGEAYLLPATAPGTLLQADLQAHFEAQESQLFALAQVKGIATDEIYDKITRRILKAFALVVLDEINLLRNQHSLAARTAEQLRTAIKNKLKSF